MSSSLVASRPTRSIGRSAPLVLHHAVMISRRGTPVADAADQLIADLRPPRSVVADAYVTHVRRVHRGQACKDEGHRLTRVLAAALDRLPRDPQDPPDGPGWFLPPA